MNVVVRRTTRDWAREFVMFMHDLRHIELCAAAPWQAVSELITRERIRMVVTGVVPTPERLRVIARVLSVLGDPTVLCALATRVHNLFSFAVVRDVIEFVLEALAALHALPWIASAHCTAELHGILLVLGRIPQETEHDRRLRRALAFLYVSTADTGCADDMSVRLPDGVVVVVPACVGDVCVDGLLWQGR